MDTQSRTGQRIIHYRYGDPNAVLKVEDVTFDQPIGTGEVLVRVTRSMIHPGDLQLIAARYSDPAEPLPNGRIPGLEAAGVIEDAASGALEGTDLALGMRVAFFASGAWQSYATVPASSLVALPDELSDDVSTQVIINTIIARQVLRLGLRDMSPRPLRILQSATNSAVGKLITNFALQEGLEPIRLVRKPDNAAALPGILPGDHVICTEGEGWQDEVRKVAGDDITLAVDGVGGPMLTEFSRLLATKGRVVSYGSLAEAPSDMALYSFKGLTVIGATILTWQDDTTPEERDEDMRAAVEVGLSQKGLFGGGHVFTLKELDQAITAVTAPGKTGNIILTF
ncbi:alcohol dehydrogenase catalytic domain-containing protein [Halomonas elongata]|uniref:alcohol dehydrogenase catalytic domain-containing protein n=1 Tax=Halomonas elongata TaxID=2746 RepID=UPI0038D47566